MKTLKPQMFYMEQNQPQHLKIGRIGEDIACRYLKSKGYNVLEKNFKRKWGEIDIICSKDFGDKSSMWNKGMNVLANVLRRAFVNKNNVPHGTTQPKIIFVEVKTLKSDDQLKPEDNLTADKQKKLIRTCQLYLSEKRLDPDIDWQIDAILINLDVVNRKAKLKHLKNAIY